ncbi:MAG: hypothetical protein K8T89_01170 [Planctomycetes bacterium]|nr:hypothetical protein [Planctomycetota bacterium]
MDDVYFSRANYLKGHWWTQMYRMLGFILLAFGSIGFLKAEQTPLKRVLGGATILLILLQIVGGSVGVGMQAGGGQHGTGVPMPDPKFDPVPPS